MDIRDWPVSRIMQLPDWCFGRRWPLGCSRYRISAGQIYDICEGGLPERGVIWEVQIRHYNSNGALAEAWLCLGERLPASITEAHSCEQLLEGVGRSGAVDEHIYLMPAERFQLSELKMYKHFAGRRLIVMFVVPDGVTQCEAEIVVSALPTEIPECLAF